MELIMTQNTSYTDTDYPCPICGDCDCRIYHFVMLVEGTDVFGYDTEQELLEAIADYGDHGLEAIRVDPNLYQPAAAKVYEDIPF
jgi:hypothetical protein